MRTLTCFTILVMLLPGGLGAQQAVSESNRVQFRGGHRFIHNGVVESPFVMTYVRNAIGIGVASDLLIGTSVVRATVIDSVPIVGLTGDVLFGGLEFEFQYAVKRWLGVRARFKLDARVGNDLGSLVAVGVNTASVYELGWLFKLASRERFMLSANVDVTNGDVSVLNIRNLIEDVVDSLPPRLVQNIPVLRAYGGLRFAYGVSPLLGVTANLSAGYGESLDRQAQNQASVQGGISTDFDLRPGTGVPLGFLLGYKFETYLGAARKSFAENSRGEFRIEYTARPDLGIGIAFNAERVQIDSEDRYYFYTVRIDLRYFF